MKGIHGRHGTFLASAADLSLSTIVSRVRGQDSESTLTIHNGKVLRRQTSNSPGQLTAATPCGTRVTVRDLFGCMPVRARLRPLPDSVAWSREWDSLIRAIAGLLLAWSADIVVTIHDEVHGTKRTVRTVQEQDGAVRTAQLLMQAGLCDVPGPASWVSIGASASGVRVSGSVCLEPTASKRAQFLCIGVTPLSEAHLADELYSEINKIFAESNFGAATDMADGVDRATRGPMDKFVREQRPRKAVDRWPIFSLGIDLDSAASVDDVLDDRRQYLTVIMSLIRTMFVEFLTTHGFYDAPVTLYGPNDVGGGSSRSRENTPDSPTKKQKMGGPDDSSGTSRVKRGSQSLPRRSKDAQSLFSTWPQRKSVQSMKMKPAKSNVDGGLEREMHGENSIEKRSRFFASPVSPEDRDADPGEAFCNPPRGIEEWDGNTLTSGDRKISRASLEAAKVIGQVDQKFILIRAPPVAEQSMKPETPQDEETGSLLILVDQHAADERCRVESLLRGYFMSTTEDLTSPTFGDAVTTGLPRPLQFELDADERPLLERSRAYFRHWGVAYDVLPLDDNNESGTTLLRVTALPSSITERCRQEPRLVIDLIRKEIWEHKEADLALGPISDSNTSWAARFLGCPRGILDLINSRSCRSKLHRIFLQCSSF